MSSPVYQYKVGDRVCIGHVGAPGVVVAVKSFALGVESITVKYDHNGVIINTFPEALRLASTVPQMSDDVYRISFMVDLDYDSHDRGRAHFHEQLAEVKKRFADDGWDFASAALSECDNQSQRLKFFSFQATKRLPGATASAAPAQPYLLVSTKTTNTITKYDIVPDDVRTPPAAASPTSPLKRSVSDFLATDMDAKPTSPEANKVNSSMEWLQSLHAQIDAVYRKEGPPAVVFANKKCYDLSLEFIQHMPTDAEISVHKRRQMEMALTDLERAKDAAAKAYMLQ